jgi:hypothetical protein
MEREQSWSFLSSTSPPAPLLVGGRQARERLSLEEDEVDEVWSVDITDVTPTEPCGVLLLILSIDDAMSRAIMLNLKEQ